MKESLNDPSINIENTEEIDIKSVLPVSNNLEQMLNLASTLDEESARIIIEKFKSRRTKREFDSLGKRIEPFILSQDEKKYLFVGKTDALADDNPGIWVIIRLALRLGYEVKHIDLESGSKRIDEKEDLLYGLSLGIDDTKPTNLVKSKRLLELGRAYIYALRVKEEFRHSGAMSALIKNNYFFGNNPNEEVNKIPIRYGIKSNIMSCYENKDYAQALYKVLLQLIREERLSTFSPEDYNITIQKFFIKFDDLVRNHYTPIRALQGKNRGNIIGYRRANKPRRSPLMTAGEMDFITEFITPAWSSLDILKKEYSNDVIQSCVHHNVIDTTIRNIFNKRWQLLAKFAKVTKKRLESIRKMDLKNAQLRKASVSSDHVITLLMGRLSPGKLFLSELRNLAGPYYDELVRDYTLKHNITRSSWDDYVNKTILMSYQKDLNIVIKDLDLIPDRVQLSKQEEMYLNDQKSIRAFFQTSNSLLVQAKRFDDINKEYATKIGDKLIEYAFALLKINLNKVDDFNYDEIGKYNFTEAIQSKDVCINVQRSIDKLISDDRIQRFIERKQNTLPTKDWSEVKEGLNNLKGVVLQSLKAHYFVSQ